MSLNRLSCWYPAACIVSSPFSSSSWWAVRKWWTHNASCRIPARQPVQRHRCTYVWTTISLPTQGSIMHPNTKSRSNHWANHPTNPSRQCRHRCVQCPPPATDQHATDATTSGSGADRPTVRGGGNKQPQHPHSPGRNWTKTGSTSQDLTRLCQKYCWTHGKFVHKGVVCNNKAPRHQNTATFSNKRGGKTYGCTWQGRPTSLMFANIDHKINLL